MSASQTRGDSILHKTPEWENLRQKMGANKVESVGENANTHNSHKNDNIHNTSTSLCDKGRTNFGLTVNFW